MTAFVRGRPIKTAEAGVVVDAGLEVGTHRFQLVVVTRDGRQSAPDIVDVVVSRVVGPVRPPLTEVVSPVRPPLTGVVRPTTTTTTTPTTTTTTLVTPVRSPAAPRTSKPRTSKPRKPAKPRSEK